ncbi:MAG: radical SAM/SPASM domain-containing protein [bacterium]
MKEIPLTQLIQTITLQRLANAGLVTASYLFSALLKKNFLWGSPFVLTVEPTNLCNLKCPLCVTGNGRMTRKTGQLSYQTFKEIIDQVGDKLVYLLLYHQGEPFLNKNFLKFVEYARSKRIFVTTSTNAHYLDEDVARQVVASGLNSAIISLDGADQEHYATYRVGGDLARVLAGVKNLVREKKRCKSRTPAIFLQFIVMKHNQHQIRSMQKLAKELQVDRLLIKSVQVETEQEARRWLPDTEALSRYRYDGRHLQTKSRGRGPCPRPWTSSLVNWDGSVVPCCFDKNGRYTLGSLKGNETFEQIWQAEKYDSFRKKMLKERKELDICSNCSQGLRLFL